MKILYIGSLERGGTCLDRLHALRRLGHEVAGLDQSAFRSRWRILRSVQYRRHPRWLLGEFNREILRAANQLVRLSMVWVDKGVWVFPETLAFLKRKFDCVLVHYTPDSQLLINRSEHFLGSICIYDHLITTKRFELEMYRSAGARDVVIAMQSYCPVRFAAPIRDLRYVRDIGFIGDYKPHYGRMIGRLAAEFDDIGVWGSRWTRATWVGRVPKAVVKGDGLWAADYVNALASFKLGLCLLSKYIPEQHTTRSIEIPAAGTFLLGERTGEHLGMFVESKEAEFFGSKEELASKAKFYLNDENARLRIAAKGRERCVRSGYDIDSVLGRVLSGIVRRES